LFVKPDVLLVADEVALRSEGIVHDFPPESLQTEGGLRHASNGYVVGPQGEAYLVFDGEPGSYGIDAVYLDNVPRAGRYSFAVDGETVHSWTSENEEVDDHLIAVSGPVALRRGSRVAFRAAPMSAGTRLVKMSVFSETVRAPVEATWLLHLDPAARIAERPFGLAATLGEAALDVHRLLPEKAALEWGRHAVAKPEVEPFTFRETTRVAIHPVFAGNDAFLLTLLHARDASAPSLGRVSAAAEKGQVRVRFERAGRETRIDWDVGARAIALAP
jgi:hypothetical protein